MADRLTALAGFHDSSYSVASNTTAGDALGGIHDGNVTQADASAGGRPMPALPPGMETEASVSLMPPPAVPQRNGTSGTAGGATNTFNPATSSASKAARAKTPPPAPTSKQQQPPDTAQKPDTRRRYGITIGGLAGDPGAAGGLSLGEDEDEDASEMAGGVEIVGGAAGAEDSGQWGSRAMNRRVAQGTNLKQLQARIDSLTTERDDLKIEVDFHRRKGSIGDIASEVISLRQEKLTYVKKVINLNDIVKKQDKVMTQLRKANKFWEGKKVEDWKNMEDELHALRKQAELQARENDKLQEEVQFFKNLREDRSREDRSRSSVRVGGKATIQELEQEVEALKEDQKVELYKLETALADMEQQRDDLADQLEELRLSKRGAAGGRRSLKSAEDSDADESNATLGTAAAERSAIIRRKEETIKDLEEREAELKMQLEALRTDLDSTQRREDQLEEEGEDASREMMAMQNILEERMANEVQHWKDELTSWKLKHERQEQRVEQLEVDREEWEAKYTNLDYELTKVEQEYQAVRLDEVEKEADDLEQDVEEQKQTIEQLEDDLDLHAGDLEYANGEVARLSDLLGHVEQERDTKADEIDQLNAELDEAEMKAEQAERRDQALKDRLNDAQLLLDEREAKLEELSEAYEVVLANKEQLANDYHEMKEELGSLKAKLTHSQDELEQTLEDLRAEERLNQQQADDYAMQLKQREEEYQSNLKSKDMDVAALENHADNLKEDVTNLKEDLHKLQSALRDQADQSQRLGQSHVNDRYALELEIDRLKREVAALERELESASRAAERKEDLLKEKDAAGIKANTDLRDLVSKLASEQQAHLGLSDRFEAQKKALREAQEEAEEARAKLEELEHQRSEYERNKSHANEQAVGQLKERNTLLLTIYQSLGRTLGADKGLGVSRKRDDADLKPFTNFGIFHDSLLSRMRRLGELRTHFDTKAKEMEAKFLEHFSAIKKQQDGQMRHINRLEQTLKTASDKQGIWRSRIVAKQAELDAAKSTNNELQQQISSLKTRTVLSSPSSNSKITNLNSRANNAERKLAAAQTSQQHAEDRLEETKRRFEQDESKWVARIKELELRCKAAEEKASRDRSSAKERLKALEEQKR
ncbi:hypothetical protein K437DRAFT_220185 [Tilletiaria anomala UBC 951]|uniref:Mto1-like Mto2p-binding domain-containing protein n=1 Tax=Tilletiaria anomala (strain ATCC 24038 / CBS 436.72 / UBC 951) TaxID=1037660 RepID=A0A066WG24_TILAU|nr:uncharacterized protein K437DRAFT_220185 [Tilletiaria anomala UBC 951]KDN52741.1 hypothetical protein K437DRAFT_220185 [Tilletiaria anomala UBC 951]